MKYENRRQSSNIRQRGRGSRGAGPALGGGGIVVALLIFLITGNPLAALQGGLAIPTESKEIEYQDVQMSQEEKELYDYSAVALADTEDAWNEILAKYGVQYREPGLNIFDDVIQTGCGIGQTGMGPFYCSADEQIYMDLDFYESLVKDFGTNDGDFILSYVISHEVGHHVQNVTGIMKDVNKMRQRASQEEFNKLTVRLELQADYLAGVVARYQYDQGYLEKGDIEDAISAAWAIGDDTIQKNQRGYVTPESFTHGTSEQRARWYQKGFDNGDLSEWDTFNIDYNSL